MNSTELTLALVDGQEAFLLGCGKWRAQQKASGDCSGTAGSGARWVEFY